MCNQGSWGGQAALLGSEHETLIPGWGIGKKKKRLSLLYAEKGKQDLFNKDPPQSPGRGGRLRWQPRRGETTIDDFFWLPVMGLT